MKNNSQDAYSKAQRTALSLLSRRRHTKEEIRRKLTERGFEQKVVKKVLSECERLQYIDDETTADFYIEELVRKRFGLLRIKEAMRSRGFDPSLIYRLIEVHLPLERESEIAVAAAEKKMSALQRETDHRKRREKVIRFLRSRGFRPSAISATLDKIEDS